MKQLALILLFAAMTSVVPGATRTAHGMVVKKPCRVEGSIVGYLPAVVVSPCSGGVRSGGELHRGDQVRTSQIGQVTFTTNHVLRCTLRNGTAVIYPKRLVVLRLKSGSVFCKQANNRKRWKFRGPNVTVNVVQTSSSAKLLRHGDDADNSVFAMVAKKAQTTVRVDQGTVRASARGISRVVRDGNQVTTKKGHKPGQVHGFTPTAAEVETFSSLELNVTTTAATDLRNLFDAQKASYGVLVSETPASAEKVQQALRGIKLLRIPADSFWPNPYGAALEIARYPANIVVVAGAFATMSSVVDELNDPDYQRLMGKTLVVVFVPVADKGVPAPRVTAIDVSNDPSAYVGFCPVTFTFTARLESKGSGLIFYTWLRSDGAMGPIYMIPANQAEPTTVTTTWQLGGYGFSYEGWEALKVLGPRVLVSSPSDFSVRCTNIG